MDPFQDLKRIESMYYNINNKKMLDSTSIELNNFLNKFKDKIMINEALLNKYEDKIDFTTLACDDFLSIKQLAKYANRINWIQFSFHYNNKPSDKFMLNLFNEMHQKSYKSTFVFWNKVWSYFNLSDEVLYSSFDNINWHFLNQNKYISEQFIDEFSDMFELNEVCENKVLSNHFLNKYNLWDKPEIVSINQKIDLDYLNKHIDKINLFKLQMNPNITTGVKRRIKELNHLSSVFSA